MTDDEQKYYDNEHTRINASYFIPYIREVCDREISRFYMDDILYLCNILHKYETSGTPMYCNEIESLLDNDIYIKNLHYDYCYKLLECTLIEMSVIECVCLLYKINENILSTLRKSYLEFRISSEELYEYISKLHMDYMKIRSLES